MNFTVEGFNRQLIRNANIYAGLAATHSRNQEKQLEILGTLPKAVTFSDLEALLFDVNANLGLMEAAVERST